MRTQAQAAARRRRLVAVLGIALLCAVVGACLLLLTQRGSAAFSAGAMLVGVGVGVPVAVGAGLLAERALQTLRR